MKREPSTVSTYLGNGHFPLSFSSSTYFTRTSLNLWRRDVTASLVVTCVESDGAKALQVESGAVKPLLVSKVFLDDPFSAKILFLYNLTLYPPQSSTNNESGIQDTIIKSLKYTYIRISLILPSIPSLYIYCFQQFAFIFHNRQKM